MSPTHTSSSKNSTPSSTNSQAGKRKSNKLQTTRDVLKQKLFTDAEEEESEQEGPEKEEPKKSSRNNRKSKRSGEATEDHRTSGEDLFSDAGGEGCQQKILDQSLLQSLQLCIYSD